MKNLLLLLSCLLILTPACGDMLDEEISEGVETSSFDARTSKSKRNCNGYDGNYFLCLLEAKVELEQATRRKNRAVSWQEYQAAEKAYNDARTKVEIAEFSYKYS